MKKQTAIFFLFASLLMACQKKKVEPIQPKAAIIHTYNDYIADWKEVEQMEKKGLGKQIIDKTDAILEKAIQQQNTSQIFKALAYRSKYVNQIEEESGYKILTRFEKEIDKAEFPVQQLLHSATAELYFQYYQQNRWRFQNRTQTTDFNPTDLRTWDLNLLLSKIDEHYQNSLTNTESLKAYPTGNLKDILSPIPTQKSLYQEDATPLRPSLFDFLADRALTYYQTNEGKVHQPQNEFRLTTDIAFSSIQQFTSHRFNTEDTTSSLYRAVQLYQLILQEHKNDETANVLIDFNLKRLQFAQNHIKEEQKDSLYIIALKQLSSQYKAQQAEIDFKLAQFYFQKTIGASNNEISHNNWKKQAHELCLLHVHKNNFGGLQCKALLEQIEVPSLQFTVENIYTPDKEISIAISHKNVTTIYFSIYSLSHKEEQNQSDETHIDYLKRITQQQAIHSWKSELVDPKDFKKHVSEVKTTALPLGKYLIVGHNAETLNVEEKLFSSSVFTVSNLAFIKENSNPRGQLRLFTLNRTTSKVVPKTQVLLYNNQYDYTTRKNNRELIGTYTSNNKGELFLDKLANSRNVEAVLIKGSDTLNHGNSFYFYQHNSSKKKRIQTFYFTDRAIYRPGQTVYFKGIVIERGENSNEIQQNYSTEATLYDVNGQKVSSAKVKTNDYGSFQGSFELPNTGLTGNFRIQSKHGNYYFSVEEYKRPSFEVLLDTSATKRQINSTLTLNGKVMAFSGAPISNATLNYRITRRARYPYWAYWRGNYPSNSSKEIANGEINAAGDGTFSFDFFAQADEVNSNVYQAHFNFEITIDATSPSGETQTLVENIVLSNQEVYLSTNLSTAAQLKDLNNLVVSAKNIDGKNIDESLEVTLWKLESPTEIDEQKKWTIVNEQLQGSSKHLDLQQFKQERKLLVEQVKSNTSTALFGDLKPGIYELVAKQVNHKAPAMVQHRFVLFNETAQQLPFPMFSYFKPLNTTAEPGEKANFLIGTSLEELHLFYQVVIKNKVIQEKWIQLNNEQQKIEIPVLESYRGGFEVLLVGVHSNRTIKFQQKINVPFTNKQLKLTLGTFRDKVEPGSKEKWTMSIQGMKGEKLAAEVLASMYDQSLDQFADKNWGLQLYRKNYSNRNWTFDNGYGFKNSRLTHNRNIQYNYPTRVYPSLNWFGFYMGRRNNIRGSRANVRYKGVSLAVHAADTEYAEDLATPTELKQSEISDIAPPPPTSIAKPQNSIRTNFKETAFFYPQLRTNASGIISFEFTMPDALTQWKFRALAHTKDLKTGTIEQSIRTQKKLSVSPTVPRFFRENDQLELKVSITNLTDRFQSGYAKIVFFDAFTNRKVDLSTGSGADQKFDVPPNQSIVKSWKIAIPKGIKAIKYRVEAQSDDFSDGEEKVIPVLLNRTLITESLPLAIRGNQQKSFSFDRFINNNSSTIDHANYAIEFTSNPAWYAVQALPYLAEKNTKCSEQVFTRLYANAIAEKVALSNPKVQQIFNLWKQEDSKELTSTLFQNQALKSILIEETPWLREAKSESEQKKRIALLFDFNKMALEKKQALQQLKNLQSPNGGWPWYKGMPNNRYITQYIVNGLGHLKKLGVPIENDPELQKALQKGISYLDARIEEDYTRLKNSNAKLNKFHLSSIQIHYLYTKSLFPETIKEPSEAFQYYLKQAEQYWTQQSLYMKGMIGLTLHYLNPKSAIPSAILAAVKDNAIQSEQLGMYWKENQNGYYWHNSAIETQALMVQFFKEVGKENSTDTEELQLWLLKQKQTQSWSNTKTTALACYALLMNNTTLNSVADIYITVGSAPLNFSAAEAGTGYVKQTYSKQEIQPQLGSIIIDKKDKGIAWGSAYWQYYENLDNITAAGVEELTVTKLLFKVLHSTKGETMTPITEENIAVGDKIRVRLRIESKRNLEFVHLKDTRAAGFEPVNVLSGYRYQDGLGYYESTRDASTNFFMDRLNKGVYVFEYDLRATVSGSFSNGFASLQCQYAPEFTAHSNGKKVTIR